MKTNFFKRLILGMIAASTFVSSGAKADPMREFILSCSYGVLAGTLVGGATLAFSDKPGDNLNKVARGASIGLYAGILLGAYIVYGVPDDSDRDGQDVVQVREPPRLMIAPLFSNERGLEGATASYSVLRF